jgi:lysyl-tRNA synthetase, class II
LEKILSIPFIEENDQTKARQEHLEALRALVGNVYPNKFERSQVVEPGRDDTVTATVEKFRAYEPKKPESGNSATEEIELANQQLNQFTVRVAGRVASPPRVMGKAAFVHISDGSSRLQLYVRKADVKAVNNDTGAVIEDENKGWELFGLLDHGDFIGVEGYLFVTKTGELSVHVRTLQFLSKALLPLPDKMHGIHDPEIRQRQRYADLIAGSLKLSDEDELTPRQVFERRSAVIREMRGFLETRGYIEVETPMLTPLATGAAARPFKTHHNALDIDLYARIAPELYLKRLLVGGFEKVYELNRNFRNEGIDRQHNPEFTMLEFYWAYADVNQMMDLCEELLRSVVMQVTGSAQITYDTFDWDSEMQPVRERHSINFAGPFQRLSMRDAVFNYWSKYWTKRPSELNGEPFDLPWLYDSFKVVALQKFVTDIDSSVDQIMRDDPSANPLEVYDGLKDSIWQSALSDTLGTQPTPLDSAESLVWLFEHIAEPDLIQPTFITDFPKPISPLSKASPADHTVAERFEFFVGALECANGFSELNDPAEQHERFKEQTQRRERGDEEAMVMDEDYIRALSYGMPPAAGIGIGIDRFVMLLTNRQSIRDVILFPHLRPERKREELSPADTIP